MEFTGKFRETLRTSEGHYIVSFCAPKVNLNELAKYKDVELDIKIEKHREAKSKDANSYLWTLCRKIAETLKEGHTAEEIYKAAIRKVGQFEIVPIKTEDVDKFIRRWRQLGLGWFAEIMGASKLSGYTNVIRYYGSSCYDSREESIVIDYVVTDCKSMGIETKPDEEIKSMCEAYNVKKHNSK